ncbi:MAG: alpha/beta hydrolase [Anaerolineaceae bacterium]|nr:alpha/beta hydrolase [Anaerolineaceae bacterium]
MNLRLDRYPSMKFPNLLPRDVEVWLPPQYAEEPSHRFPVIYMHDGQNLFEPEKSYSGVTWGVAEAITRLSGEGLITPAIVVGIGNTTNRFGDYQPTRPFETPEGRAFREQEEIKDLESDNDFVADDYLKFIVDVVKPMIDETYRTQPEPEHTSVIGSSMGGLISLYAICEYPEVFSCAGCVSTHWPTVFPFILPYLEQYLPDPNSHKIYFDHGTVELDGEYPPFQRQVDELMRRKGYSEEVNWMTRVYEGAKHHETAWQARIHVPLEFFLGK